MQGSVCPARHANSEHGAARQPLRAVWHVEHGTCLKRGLLTATQHRSGAPPPSAPNPAQGSGQSKKLGVRAHAHLQKTFSCSRHGAMHYTHRCIRQLDWTRGGIC